MSDGMSDMHALGDLATKVHAAAVDLGEAIRSADTGYRGLTIDPIEVANEVLSAWGVRLERIK